MDKQFVRILMLSVLLPAGAGLAEAIDRDHLSLAVTRPDLISMSVSEVPGEALQRRSIEGRRFLEVVAAEEAAAMRGSGQ